MYKIPAHCPLQHVVSSLFFPLHPSNCPVIGKKKKKNSTGWFADPVMGSLDVAVDVFELEFLDLTLTNQI